MACPTCDHTMQCVGEIQPAAQLVYWCPRCGTLKVKDSAPPIIEPRLVPRVRAFLSELPLGLQKRAWTLGLYDSTHEEPIYPVE